MAKTRREILSLLGVSAAALGATVSQLAAQGGAREGGLDVAVVGAGAAGLTAGFLLDRAGLRFEIFEAAAIHGGRAKKDTRLADIPLDLGGEWVHGPASLLNRLSQTQSAARRTVEYRPMTCQVWDGQRLYQDDSYALDWRGEQRFVSTTWFDFFNDYMAAGLSDRLRLNTPVAAIDHGSEGVELRLAGGRQVAARHVIVTVPLSVLKAGDIRFTPALSKARQQALNGAVMQDGLKLFLRFSTRFYPDLIAYESGYHEDESAILFYNAALDKPTRQNILGLFAHGPLATPYARLSEAALLRRVLAELDAMYGGAASRAYQAHVLQNWSKAPFHRGTYSHFTRSTPDMLGASIGGRVHFAGEAYNRHADGEWGYMHVAARSAYDALREIGR